MSLQQCLVLRTVPLSHVVVRNLTRTLSLNHSVIASQRCCRTHSPLKAKVLPSVPVRTRMIYEPKRRHAIAKHKEDKVDTEYRMVYHNSMGNYYEYGRQGAVFFAFPVLLADLAFVYQHGFGRSNLPYEEIHSSVTMLDPTLFASLATVFVLGLLYTTLRITGVYMSRMYYNSNTDHFIGIRQKGLFGKQQFPFTIDDVEPIPVSENLFARLLKGNFSIKGRAFLMNNQDFADMSIFNRFARHTFDQQFTSSPLDDVRTMKEEFHKKQQDYIAKKRQEMKRRQRK